MVWGWGAAPCPGKGLVQAEAACSSWCLAVPMPEGLEPGNPLVGLWGECEGALWTKALLSMRVPGVDRSISVVPAWKMHRNSHQR